MSTTNISGPESAVTDVEKGKVEVVATAATRFDQDVEIQIEKFEISQQKCDERLGVMLLLDYKKRLDEMNERYQSLMRHMVAPSGNLVTFEQEVYSMFKRMPLWSLLHSCSVTELVRLT